MLVITLRVTQRDRDSLPARGGSSLPNLAPFARRGRATGQRTYCPCSVCSEPEAHPLQAVRGLAAALSHANATGNPGGLRFARRLGRSPLDGHCGPAAPRRLHPRGRRTQVLTVFRLPAGGAVRQGSRSSRSRRAGTGHYLPQPSSHRFHLAKAGLLPAGYRVVASVVEMTPASACWYITVTENSLLSKCQPSSSPSPKIAISTASSGSAPRYSTRLPSTAAMNAVRSSDSYSRRIAASAGIWS